MNAQRQFNITGDTIRKSMEKLSSGFKINRAADDAAGLTISEKMRSLIRSMNQGSYNIQDGISLMQVADGALSEVHGMLHRMTELSVKAANGTNTAADRAAIQEEIKQLSSEITRIGKSTTFNTLHILDNGEPVAEAESITELVKCGSAQYKHLGEAYEYNGKYFPAAILDFSGLNESKIKRLTDKSFSFVCGQGCGETFKFTFVTGKESSLDKRNQGAVVHNYNVNIDGVTDGKGLVDRIYDTVVANYLIDPNGKKDYNKDEFGGRYVSHATVLAKNGDEKLVVAEWPSSSVYNSGGYTDRTFAANYYLQPGNQSSNKGYIDCDEITKARDDEEFINQFNIVCSNVAGDSELIETYRMNATVLGVDELNVTTEENARKALAKVDAAVAKVSKHRSAYGAFQNRLEHSYANNENKAENLTAAESRIRDTDMSTEMVKLTTANIISRAGSAMLSQAMQNPQAILQLLQ